MLFDSPPAPLGSRKPETFVGACRFAYRNRPLRRKSARARAPGNIRSPPPRFFFMPVPTTKSDSTPPPICSSLPPHENKSYSRKNTAAKIGVYPRATAESQSVAPLPSPPDLRPLQITKAQTAHFNVTLLSQALLRKLLYTFSTFITPRPTPDRIKKQNK